MDLRRAARASRVGRRLQTYVTQLLAHSFSVPQLSLAKKLRLKTSLAAYPRAQVESFSGESDARGSDPLHAVR
jgi:hypothetical protein